MGGTTWSSRDKDEGSYVQNVQISFLRKIALLMQTLMLAAPRSHLHPSSTRLSCPRAPRPRRLPELPSDRWCEGPFASRAGSP